MNLRAPIIILPESKSEPGLFIVADLGYLTVKSEPVKPEAKKNLLQKQGQVLKEDEFTRLVSMMYDKFRISLRNVQISLGRNLQECREAVSVSGSLVVFFQRNKFYISHFLFVGRQGFSSPQDLATNRGRGFCVFSEVRRCYGPSQAENRGCFPFTPC